ncbi:uncharacterized protein RMCN_4310 [Mycolicibacterium novocastrense]|nr:hypothetical protein [Mycolicibacterium novocastrense]GAT11177.1 uncharacterized protein RMCN_4310 [Mycolicibacterium novocastrense]
MVAGDSIASSGATVARARREWLAKLLIGAVIGALIGAIAGWLVFRTAATESTATAYVRLLQPVDLTAVAASASQTTPDTMDNVRRYVTGEVAFLSGNGFAQVVARKVGQSEPVELEIEHDDDSAVVGISSSSDDGDAARRIVQAAVDVYAENLEQRVDGELRTIIPAFSEWERAARESGNVGRAQEIQRLRENVLLQADSSSMVILQTPTVNSASGSDWLMGALLGAVVGGAVVPLAMNSRRRRAGRVTTFDDLADFVDGTFYPAVEVGQSRDPFRDRAGATLARTLYAQCPSHGQSRVVVLIGASATSPTPVVLTLFEFAAGERGPTRTITLARDDSAALAPAGEAATVLIDAGTIGTSRRIPEAIALATVVVVVAEIGVDTVTQVLTVRASVPAQTPVWSVLTYRPRGRPGSTGRHESRTVRTDNGDTDGRP